MDFKMSFDEEFIDIKCAKCSTSLKDVVKLDEKNDIVIEEGSVNCPKCNNLIYRNETEPNGTSIFIFAMSNYYKDYKVLIKKRI